MADLEAVAKWCDANAEMGDNIGMPPEESARFRAAAAACRELADKREQRDYGDILSGPFNPKLDEITDAALAEIE